MTEQLNITHRCVFLAEHSSESTCVQEDKISRIEFLDGRLAIREIIKEEIRDLTVQWDGVDVFSARYDPASYERRVNRHEWEVNGELSIHSYSPGEWEDVITKLYVRKFLG